MSRSILLAPVVFLAAALPAAYGQCPDGGHCQLPKVFADDAVAETALGLEIAIENDRMMITAAQVNRAVYVYQHVAGAWVQVQKINSPGAGIDDFGCDLAMSADYALVGASLDAEHVLNGGAAYLYEWNGAAYQLVQKVTLPTPAASDRFGISVTMLGNYAAIGAPGRDSAYIAWLPSEPLLLNELVGPAGANQFGFDVTMSNTFVAIGAPEDFSNGNAGAVYLYEKTMTSNGLFQKLTSADHAPAEPQPQDLFGITVEMNTHDLVIGATGRDDLGDGSGAAYTYRRELQPFPLPPVWVSNDKLLPCAGGAGSAFGASLDVDPKSGGRILVGAPWEDSMGANAGAAYVYERSGPVFAYSWAEEDRLLACDATAGDRFGTAVRIRGGNPVIGALMNDEVAHNGGAAYPFSLDGASTGCLCDCDVSPSFVEYGAAKGGALGEPHLGGGDPAYLGGTASIVLTHGRPGDFPILALGLSSAATPFDEGMLHVGNPTLIALPVPIPGTGELELFGAIPADAHLCGVTVYTQVLYVDTTAAGFLHTAQTNGLAVTIGS